MSNTKFSNFILLNHPLVKKDVTVLRNVNTPSESFRSAVRRISSLLAVEISKNMKVTKLEVRTPLELTIGFELAQQVVLVPVLRAGLGMVGGFLDIIPDAKVGHIGLQRNEETLKPKQYYYKTPKNLRLSKVILLDPMLATGGSSSQAINNLKKRGSKECMFACIVASPEGLYKIKKDHPDVKIFGAALDRGLNEWGYIVPGLGDAGDRTFGTL
ncbi:MAG: uracil phosphoribosyltransferase [Ignavibacteria bacterium RBG_16_35_7]|nr:MAG: uracil phosphoribosyltransferase [Ignavibacteria bacterium RBG_16_35_7]